MKINFGDIKDEDFYSDFFTHIYLTGEIDSKKIENLINDVKKANSLKEPKPILIHITSLGGSLQDGIRLLTIYKISKLPIVTIIDNYCFSISTLLFLNSSYRIMTKNSFCLLHEYRLQGVINEERKGIFNFLDKLEATFKAIIVLYMKKSSFKKKELEDLLKRNILLDYKTCFKKKLVDRIIDVNYKHKKQHYSITKLLKLTTPNNFTISCDLSNQQIDNKLKQIDKTKPCVIYTTFTDCIKEKKLNDIIKIFINIFKSLNLIERIKSIPSYKIAIIDVPITIENLLPFLYTNKIYMYSHTYIICNYPLLSITSNGFTLQDNITNYDLLIGHIKSILKEKTKLKDIDNKFMIINASKAKKLGLCHEILHI